MFSRLSVACIKLIDLMRTSGFEAYPVGGCVRDFLLNKPCNDVDITTNALPTDVLRIFKDYTTFEVGIAHGTVGVLIDGETFEVTTYRFDGDYLDNRHPSKVCFSTNLADDLKRRDFTINAMAYGEDVVDLFGGREDLENRVIRCVGDANERFNEDALRIMRAIRFASTLDFEIEEKTAIAIRKNVQLIKNISKERILVEFVKCICGDNIKSVLLNYSEVFEIIIPEFSPMIGFAQNSKYHIYNVLEHSAVVVENTPKVRELRLAAFFHDIGKPQAYTQDADGVGHFKGHTQISMAITNKILLGLKIDKKTLKDVLMLIEYHDVRIMAQSSQIKRALNKMGARLFYMLLELKRADALGKSSKYFDKLNQLDEMKKIAEDIIERGECYSLKQLSIDGNDIKALGVTDGNLIGEYLKTALNMVIDGVLGNDKQIITEFLLKNYKIQ